MIFKIINKRFKKFLHQRRYADDIKINTKLCLVSLFMGKIQVDGGRL